MTPLLMLAAAVSAFNLTCTGTVRKVASDEPSKPYSRTYRIDLDKRIYCTEDCKDTFPIADVSQTRLTIQQRRELKGDLLIEETDIINRETGKHYNWFKMYSTSVYEGQCEPSAFTGFPKVQTKF